MALFSTAVSWLLVCLGNPGKEYEGTRHNAGFLAADALAKRDGLRITRLRFSALTDTCTLGGAKVLVMKPQTYMNLSGDAVRQAMGFYHVPTDRILVISDDVSLPLGKLRVRRSGSAGGHNGLKDIIAKCGGDGFPRVKIGVGAPAHPEYDMKDWVLGGFHGEDAKIMAAAAERAIQAAETVIQYGADRAMNEFNG